MVTPVASNPMHTLDSGDVSLNGPPSEFISPKYSKNDHKDLFSPKTKSTLKKATIPNYDTGLFL